MREIFFRGKDIKGNWHIGLLSHIGNAWYISNKAGVATAFEVIPSTIGEYTGLTDKNGKKIFEGDIVKATVIYNEMYRDSTRKVTRIYEVKYHEKFCYFYLARNKNNILFDGNWSYSVVGFEVIDDIHDNPELLKGGSE